MQHKYSLLVDLYIEICYNAAVGNVVVMVVLLLRKDPMEIASNLKATSTSSSRLGPESMPGSKPRTVAKARSKPSTVQVEDVQLPETEEASTQVVTQSVNTADKWIKFVAWFAMMGAMSGYGIHQHDDTILFGVMILVTIGCGFGQAIEPLIKFLEAKGISPTKTLKS